MTSHRDDNAPDTTRVSEEDAHRLLARAAELDARDTASMSLAQLRDVAREAGIAPEPFDRALAELKAGTLGPGTVGQAVAARLATYRRQASLLAWVGAALITPGDIVFQTGLIALAQYGAYEGCVRISHWLGRHPPRPSSPRRPTVSLGAAVREPDPTEETRLQRRHLLLTGT